MKICLVMIVKNESHVLGRALDSVADLVDYVYIQDNGSKPQEAYDMQNLIEARLPTKPYVYDTVEWIDFATNRTMVLDAATNAFPFANWLFMLDADDYVESAKIPIVTDQTAFNVKVKSPGIVYPRTQLFKACEGWHYRGVVHEFPDCTITNSWNIGEAPIVVISTREGDRNRNGRKYQDDAALLEKALADRNTEADLIPRYQFYLAQSYEGYGDIDKAVEWCIIRADNEKGYIEERYVALLRLARMYKDKGASELIVADVCREAQEICPWRREAAHVAVSMFNGLDRHKDALNFYSGYPFTGHTPVGLFIEPDVYAWQYAEQGGIAAYYCQSYKQSVNLFAKAIKAQPSNPIDMKRLIDNLQFPIDKL